jgi:hypothetical protein
MGKQPGQAQQRPPAATRIPRSSGSRPTISPDRGSDPENCAAGYPARPLGGWGTGSGPGMGPGSGIGSGPGTGNGSGSGIRISPRVASARCGSTSN